MPDEAEQFHRRDFIRRTSYTAATAATFYSAAMTTDALAQPPAAPFMMGEVPDNTNYNYGSS